MYCWGYNNSGQLGDGSMTTHLTPSGPSLGYNTSGQLGNNTLTTSTTPVQTASLTSGVTALAAGQEHSCAILDGSAWCWGHNFFGELGDGTKTNRPAPTSILSGGVQEIAAG